MNEAPLPEIYKAVVNLEDQYSIWPAEKSLPPGWRDGGKTGPKDIVLAYVAQTWVDMRPKSLRLAMERDSAGAEAP